MGNDSLKLARFIFGHLTGTECRRGLARGWLLWLRASVGTLLATGLLFLIWSWWLTARFDSTYRCTWLRSPFCLSAAALVLLTITAVQAPAVLAGSLAGERERGILQLLLTTTASPREIVEGRLLGKLSQVGMVIVAGFPIVAFLAPLDGLRVTAGAGDRATARRGRLGRRRAGGRGIGGVAPRPRRATDRLHPDDLAHDEPALGLRGAARAARSPCSSGSTPIAA